MYFRQARLAFSAKYTPVTESIYRYQCKYARVSRVFLYNMSTTGIWLCLFLDRLQTFSSGIEP